MKKLLSVLLVLGAITATAEDSYLYWMVGNESVGATYDTVKVKANNENGTTTYLTLYDADGGSYGESASYGVGKTVVDNHRAAGSGLYAALGSDPTYTSFVIELWNSTSFVYDSETLAYSTALANNNITTANSMVLADTWAPTAFSIPEPNSAMLLLLGCAALGLRRRQRKA